MINSEFLLEYNLPLGYRWLTISGQILFPYYGCSGGVTPSACSFIVRNMLKGFDGDLGIDVIHSDTNGQWASLRFLYTDSREEIIRKIDLTVQRLEELESWQTISQQ
jgi:hypothetical protein